MRQPSLVLIGLSGNALEILEAAEAAYPVAAILSDDPAHQPAFEGYPVVPLDRARSFEDARFLFLIGSERSFKRRAEMIGRLGLPHERYATLCHPAALVSRFARLGRGTVLYAGVTVTSNGVIGDHVMILPGSIVHHDARIGDYSIIGSNVTIAGSVEIGASCYVGSASSIRNGVSVGDGALIGMGANVVHDVAPGEVVVGNPAHPIQRRDRTR